jgi:GAF domain-containing protein
MVPAEAGSVLRGSINDDVLTFVAVAGPAANDLIGRKLRFGEGLVGACFDLGITIQVNDVAADPRHMPDIDRETGFRTRSVLCVPVRTDDAFFGAVQILNPPGRFQSWHVDVVEQVAKSLASTLQGVS